MHPIVYVLQNFDCNFANLVAPPTDGTEKCLVHFKVHLATTHGENSIQIYA